MKKNQTLRRDAITKGGWGRGMDNKLSRTTKHNLDRKVDKRRRRIGKAEAQAEE